MSSGVPSVLILGHSFVKRLKRDLRSHFVPWDDGNWGTMSLHLQGVSGRTVAKLWSSDLHVVEWIAPDVLILLRHWSMSLRSHVRSKQAVQRSLSSRLVVKDLFTHKGKENMSDTDILDDQEEDLPPEDTEQNHLRSLLAKMNENMATMSNSLRELNDKQRHVVSADHSNHTAGRAIQPGIVARQSCKVA